MHFIFSYFKNYDQVASWDDMADLVFTPLLRLGPYLAQSPVLFTKILRLFAKYVELNKDDICNQALAG